MKKFFNIVFCIALVGLFFTSCNKDKVDDTDIPESDLLPAAFMVDVPDAISSDKLEGTRLSASGELKGSDLYKHQRIFIKVGEKAAEMVQNIMNAIKKHKINKPMDFTFVSGDDGRTKVAKVTANVAFDNVTWDLKLNILDQDSSNAIQVFWNKSPVKGTAILSLKNMNRNDTNMQNAVIKIEYSEAETAYQKQMIVSISDMPVRDKFGINNLKMFVGKNGNILDIYGNTNHPNITIIDTTYTGGRNWAFVAHANDSLNFAVASVALPPSSVSSTANMLTDYSVYKVLEGEIQKAGITDSAQIADFLKEAKAPAFFEGGQGFVSAGENIPSNPGFTADFRDLSALTPYIPSDIAAMVVTFQK